MAKIVAISDHKEKVEQYKSLISQLVADGETKGLAAVLDNLVSESTPLVVSRLVLGSFTESIQKLSPQLLLDIGHHALKGLQPRIQSFEDQFSSISEALAVIYQNDGKYRQAAEMWANIPLDSGQRVIDDKYKLKVYVSTAENFLLENDYKAAEKSVSRAAALEKDAQDPSLSLRFKIANATLLDFKGKTLDASRHFYEISQQVPVEQKIQFLQQAINTAVLSAAGPQRSKVLSILYKDDLAPKSPNYTFLENVFLDKVLRGESVSQFAGQLKPHHVAKNEEGSSLLETALVQHNLLAASRIYNNISFEQMGALLQIAPEKAEKVAAQMIMTGRLAASIDQIEGMVSFEAAAATLPLWDSQIEGVCHSVERVIQLLSRTNPDIVTGL